MSAVKHIPVNYFLLNKELTIIECSDLAIQTFGDAIDFLELIDSESKEKAKRILYSLDKKTTELVMKTTASPLSLFEMKIHWDGQLGHVVCLEQDDRIQRLIDVVDKHRTRLAKTDFELLEKKEQLEHSLSLISELSAPYITIANGIVLIPLFGHLDKKLIVNNSLRILKQINNSNIERILFDFHGIGNLSTEGILELRNLMTELSLMGVRSYIIGLHPEHAKIIHKSGIQTGSLFLKNLNEAIRTFIVS
ncbi:STAS domain-containing protein [Metabacillus litoralis]|uniref:STAS domain-containing protein n=1 Tax=Metabacillus litoralis TaxID=152268 RepID=UPI001CFE966E|nr:STAS domain-containing protein [Metabacillus litoralis]